MTERANYWARLVASWEESGLSQTEFCRRRGVKMVTFAWWKRRLRAEGGSLTRPSVATSRRPDRQSSPVPFVEVRLPSASPSYEVLLARGRSIRVPAEFDPQALSRLIAAVESC